MCCVITATLQTTTVISISFGITDNPKQCEYKSKVLLQLSC